jgi:hypothetical protein
MYETVIQELLVQQHFMRYNIKYKYDPVRSDCCGQALQIDAVLMIRAASARSRLWDASRLPSWQTSTPTAG